MDELVKALVEQLALAGLETAIGPGTAIALVDLADLIIERLMTVTISCEEYTGGQFSPVQCLPGRWSPDDWAFRARCCAHCPIYTKALTAAQKGKS
jgi:hypothetical protein